MAKTILFCGGDEEERTTANTTQFWQIFGMLVKNNTEANCEMIMRSPGILSNLDVFVGLNNINNTCAIKVRLNGADTSLAVTVGASGTGNYINDVDTVTVAAGDKICLTTVPFSGSTGTLGLGYARTVFAATTDTVTRMTVSPNTASTAGTNLSDASTSYFFPLNGHITTNTFTEAQVKCRQRRVGSFKNLAIKVRTNTRGTNTLIKLRKNGTDATNVITVAGAATGWIEDTTHTDTIAVGDDFNFTVVTGSGSGSFIVDYIAVDYVSADGYGQCVLSAFNSPDSVGQNDNKDIQLAGDNLWFTVNLDHVQSRIPPDAELIFSDLTILVRSNNVDGTSTLTFRKNNTNGNQTVTIPANTAGVFSDITNTDITSAEDQVNYRLATGAGGTFDVVNVDVISCWTHDPTSVGPQLNAECVISDIDTSGEFSVDYTTADATARQTLWFTLST